MGSLGNLIATETDTGNPSSTTITCTDDQNGTLHLFWLTSFISDSAFQATIDTITDSKSGTWTLSTSTLPFIGATDAYYYDGVNFVDFLIGSFIRTAGDSLVNGDTITVTYDTPRFPDYAIYIAQCINGTLDLATEQKFGTYNTPVDITSGTFISYSNGLPGYPTQLWRTEYSNLNPACVNDSAFIGLFGCYGGSGFVPDQIGSNAVEVTNSPLTLALTFESNVSATGITIEPGGSWTSPPAANSQEGNYQFILNDATSSIEIGAIKFRAWQAGDA